MELLLSFVAGALISGFIVFYFAKQRIKQLEEQLKMQTSAATSSRTELAVLTQNLNAAEEKLASQKSELQEIGNQFRHEFRSLADSILEEKSKKFTSMSEEKMRSILDPFRMNLVEFKQKVEETYDKESKQRFSLEVEINRLMQLNQQLSSDANNLTNALKNNNKVQGNWGEMILESILEHCGLTKGREYHVQEFLRDESGNIIKDEHGRGLQPDIIVTYPDGRKVVIDSKVSLLAFEQYVSCTDADSVHACLREHCRSLKMHIDGLSKKNYPKYAGSALDYVIMFVPVEPAFLAALKEDQNLWKYAYDRKIMMVSPTNLLAILKIIADLWKVELQSRNAIEIADKAGMLYDKFAGFLESMDSIQLYLSKATDAYVQSRKKLSDGSGNIIRRMEELKKMGAKATKQLPEN